MGDWDVVSSEPTAPKGEWDVVSHSPETQAAAPKSFSERLSDVWHNPTPGSAFDIAHRAYYGVKGAIEGSEAAVAPQVGSDEEEQQRQIIEQTGPAEALKAASVLAPTGVPGGGLLGVPKGTDARLTPPPLPRAQPPALPPEAAANPAIPLQVDRPPRAPGVPAIDLLPPETPHALPPERSSLSAAGVGSALTDLSPDTLAFLRQKMQQQPFNANSLQDRLDQMSEHQFFGEITPSLETDMQGIAGPAGPGKHEIVASVLQRSAEDRERQQALFNHAFGENENVPQLRRSIEIDRDQAASPLYQQFRQTPIQPSPQIDAMLPRLRAAGALQAANKALAEEGLPQTNGFVEGAQEHAFDEGTEVTRVPTAAAFDYAKQHLDRLISSAVENGDANSARRYTQMKADLDAALDAHPTAGRVWQLARQAYAGPTSRMEAMRFGQRVLTGNVDAEELPFLTSGYNDAQQQAMRVGMRSYLENLLNSRADVPAEVFNKVLSPNSVAKIRWAIGDEAADRLIAGMQHERNMRNAPTRLLYGSPTANRSKAIEEWSGGPQQASVSINPIDMLHKASTPFKTAATLGMNKVLESQAQKRAADSMAKWARIREESAPIFTLQGPERDAAARYLFGATQPYARGGKVTAKKTKASVNYRHATGKERCKTCKHSYGATGDRRCELVMGQIYPDDTCNLWAEKTHRADGGAVHNHNPSEAQKKAGNYAKTHKSFHGLDITIENLKGHSRSGVGKDGKKWSVRMPAHYGYIKRTEGADGDHVDCYLGPNEKSDQVFVVDQKDAETGRFDEHKCLLGFNSEAEAKKTYLAGFSDGKNRIKHMKRMSLSEFKDWLQNGDTSKQIAHYALGGAVHRAIKPDVYL